MDEKKITLNADQILRKIFTPNVRGYDPDEVDSYLDQICQDYQAFERYYKESRSYIVDLETQLRSSKEEASRLTVENAGMKERLSGVKDGTAVSNENINLLNRIRKLELALFNAGVDPRKI